MPSSALNECNFSRLIYVVRSWESLRHWERTLQTNIFFQPSEPRLQDALNDCEPTSEYPLQLAYWSWGAEPGPSHLCFARCSQQRCIDVIKVSRDSENAASFTTSKQQQTQPLTEMVKPDTHLTETLTHWHQRWSQFHILANRKNVWSLRKWTLRCPSTQDSGTGDRFRRSLAVGIGRAFKDSVGFVTRWTTRKASERL